MTCKTRSAALLIGALGAVTRCGGERAAIRLGWKSWSVPYYDVPYYAITHFNVPPQDAPVLMQTAALTQKTDTNTLYGTMGVCAVSPSMEKMGLGTGSSMTNGMSLYPQGSALRRFPDARFNVDLQVAAEAASVQILQQPEHGEIVAVPQDNGFYYVPQQGYTGNDKIVFLVNIGGRNVKTVYYIKVVDSELNSKTFDALYAKYCPPPTDWISSTTDANLIAGSLTSGFSLAPSSIE